MGQHFRVEGESQGTDDMEGRGAGILMEEPRIDPKVTLGQVRELGADNSHLRLAYLERAVNWHRCEQEGILRKGKCGQGQVGRASPRVLSGH